MPQVMRPKRVRLVYPRVQWKALRKIIRSDEHANEFFLLSLPLSLLFYNLFTRLVLITRKSYDFGTFVIRMRIKWHDEKQVFARCERN